VTGIIRGEEWERNLQTAPKGIVSGDLLGQNIVISMLPTKPTDRYMHLFLPQFNVLVGSEIGCERHLLRKIRAWADRHVTSSAQ
jgi:hypothetical protein